MCVCVRVRVCVCVCVCLFVSRLYKMLLSRKLLVVPADMPLAPIQHNCLFRIRGGDPMAPAGLLISSCMILNPRWDPHTFTC